MYNIGHAFMYLTRRNLFETQWESHQITEKKTLLKYDCRKGCERVTYILSHVFATSSARSCILFSDLGVLSCI